MVSPHPRDRFITVYGRKPVMEALERDDIQVEQVLVADRSSGELVDKIVGLAEAAGVPVRRVPRREVSRVSRNQRQDQGVAADVRAPRMDDLHTALEAGQVRGPLVAVDGLTTPANLGMVIRAATGAGVGAIVLPRQGCPEVGPMVVKASAGVAFGARILRCARLPEGLDALAAHGFRMLGLATDASTSLWETNLTERDVLILGGETHGLGEAVARRLDGRVHIPMAAGVESLNVATAAAIVAFELRRRGLCSGSP